MFRSALFWDFRALMRKKQGCGFGIFIGNWYHYTENSMMYYVLYYETKVLS